MRWISVAGAVGFVAVVGFAPPATGVIRTTAVSDSDEIALGAALVAQFDKDRGVAPSPQSQRIERYLQSVADSLGKDTKRKLPLRIHHDPHPAIKSGFALPGGHIVIWGGVLSYMTTEDELAAIIAHEMEHQDDDQVPNRIDSLVKANTLDLGDASKWRWQWFGASQGVAREALC